jgi:hypothetical protein
MKTLLFLILLAAPLAATVMMFATVSTANGIGAYNWKFMCLDTYGGHHTYQIKVGWTMPTANTSSWKVKIAGF